MRKNLSIEQVIQKAALLEFYSKETKGKTVNQLTKHWTKYREKKFIIEELPKYKRRYYKTRPDKRAALREKYYEKKEIKAAALEYGMLKPYKKVKQKYSKQIYYKLRGGKDTLRIEDKIDKTIRTLFEKRSNIKYILVTAKIKLPSGQVMFVSDTLTIDDLELFEELEETAVSRMMDKLGFVDKYAGFEIIETSLRVVYDISNQN
jgi:hypothetical protein